ncbi:hypothetical protein [Lysobacter sp. A3-1-A15]|uniref:hypothetical protein n=1 Tax=Novilysobacter viscosus TaxID=3098602 RepID=UPI003982D7BB
MAAVLAGRAPQVWEAIQAGACVDCAGPDGRALAFHALRHVNAECLRMLLVTGACNEIQCPQGGGLLHWALHAAPVRALLAAGLKATARDNHGATPLHYPKSRDAAELLVNSGVDLGAMDAGWRTPRQALMAHLDEAHLAGDRTLASQLDKSVAWLAHMADTGGAAPRQPPPPTTEGLWATWRAHALTRR